MDAHVLHLAFGFQPLHSGSLYVSCLLHAAVVPQVPEDDEHVFHPSSQEQFSRNVSQKPWDEETGTSRAPEARLLRNVAFLLLSIPLTVFFIQAY